jgi:uncharacterized cupredoxin-like copper-binding protein
MRSAIPLMLAIAALPVYAHEHAAAPAAVVGSAGDPRKVDRTIRVVMTDAMRFEPSSVSVNEGDTVRFVVQNKGKLRHEFVLGSEEELIQHAAMMNSDPGMTHSAPNMVPLNGGASGSVVWRFTTAGAVEFACLQAGHFDAGMKGTVVVKPRSTARRSPDT